MNRRIKLSAGYIVISVVIVCFGMCIMEVQADYPSSTTTPLAVDLDVNGKKITNIGDVITKGPWVDVRAFGAVGDGVADDTTAIQNTINYASNFTYGGVVFLPPGKYKTTATITLKKNVSLYGQTRSIWNYPSATMGGSIITPKFEGNALNYWGASAEDINVTIAHILIWGDSAYNLNGSGIYLTNACGVTIEKVVVRDMPAGITAVGGWSIYVFDCYVNGRAGVGYLYNIQSEQSVLRGAVSDNGQWSLYTTTNVTVEGCHFEGASSGAIWLYAANARVTTNKIYTTPTGIWIQGTSNIVANNLISTSTNGVVVEHNTNIIANNQIWSGSYGITVVYQNGGRNTLIEGNRIVANSGIKAWGSNDIIKGNWIELQLGSTGNGIDVSAPGMVISSNVINSSGSGAYSINITYGDDAFPGVYCANVVNKPINLGTFNNRIFDNPGYISENSGLSGYIASGGTIAHGLATTPTVVLLTPEGNSARSFSAIADSVNIKVYFSGIGTRRFYWRASLQQSK